MVHRILQTNYGDANLDRYFDTGDLVFVLIAGKYEDGVPMNASWEEGDWNGDGDFTTNDLVIALQSGTYEAAAQAVAATPATATDAAISRESTNGIAGADFTVPQATALSTEKREARVLSIYCVRETSGGSPNPVDPQRSRRLLGLAGRFFVPGADRAYRSARWRSLGGRHPSGIPAPVGRLSARRPTCLKSASVLLTFAGLASSADLRQVGLQRNVGLHRTRPSAVKTSCLRIDPAPICIS